MSKDNSNNNGIPTRKGVYLRNPGGNKSGSASVNAKSTSAAGNRKVNTQSSAPSKSPQINGQRAVQSTQKSAKTVQTKKTPAELAREKEYAEKMQREKLRIEAEKRKYKAMKRKERQMRIEYIKKHSLYVLRNVLFGLAAALAVILIIMIMYYRNMSKFDSTGYAYTFNLYGYIDENDTSEKNTKLLNDRANGKEIPQKVISEEAVTKDGYAYLPFSSVSNYFDFTISGDKGARTIMVGSSQSEYSGSNSAVFSFDSSQATVNGTPQMLSAGAFMKGSELYIPYDFFKTFVKGIEISEAEKNGTITVSITKTQRAVYFSASDNNPLTAPDINKYNTSALPEHKYGIDLSEYEKHINPADPDKYLFLVNTENRLAADYAPDDLTDLINTRNDRAAQQMRHDAAMALEAFLKAAYLNGHSDVTVTSAYRSYAYQSSLFNTRLQQNKITYGAALAEAKTAEFTAYPGASEHQSGLCCDMHNLPSAMQSFANEDAYAWLYEHCADFGFILRYPKSKEDVTGIKFEPWHYRFVGRYHAQKIMESGLCLEEYVAKLSSEN